MLIILISILSGIISGMGIGGGTILIPALTIFFKIPQHIAQSVNLLSFIPTGIVAIVSHIKQGNIEKKITFKLILGGLLGAIIGSYFAIKLPGSVLRRLFGVFLLVMGIYEVCCKNKCSK
jgi:uncharacterized membrane protein YfcA